MEKNFFTDNKKKWLVLPGGKSRVSIPKIIRWPDIIIKWRYNYFSKFWSKERQWEHKRYKELFTGKDVLEIGSGMGYDAIVYSDYAKSYTCAELSITQLFFLEKIFSIKGKNIQLEYLKDPLNHTFSKKFNAFYAHGVLHHVPFEIAKKQFENIDRYLEKGAIVVFLMYPKERWEHCGKPTFEEFGNYTDGGCPWAEYYDEEKILALVGPGYNLKKIIKWGKRNIEFVNYELIKN